MHMMVMGAGKGAVEPGGDEDSVSEGDVADIDDEEVDYFFGQPPLV